MIVWLVSFMMIISASIAEVGKVSKIVGLNDSYILRNQQKLSLTQDFDIEKGDEVFTQNTVLVIYLYPTTQISLAKNTQIKITENLIKGDSNKEKSFSIINFIKGIVRLQVTKDNNLEIDQTIVADSVSFAVRGTDFEVSSDGEDFDLDVIEGEVEVTSPFVQTFVPEIVKANEGFRFNKKAKNFQRRKFLAKFKNHPGFARKEEIREKWKQKRLNRREGKRGKRDERLVSRKKRDRSKR